MHNTLIKKQFQCLNNPHSALGSGTFTFVAAPYETKFHVLIYFVFCKLVNLFDHVI